MDRHVKESLEQALGGAVSRTRRVSGGDINEAFELHLPDGTRAFLKYNGSPRGASILTAECTALETLRASGAVRVPKVLKSGVSGQAGWLLLEYLTAVQPSADHWITLGTQLAALHRCTASTFGFETDNFIGSLPQSNQSHPTWAAFYAAERLKPQFDLATGYFDDQQQMAISRLLEQLPSLVVEEPPALIHGDLWGGNVHITESGPCLIDPAVCYASREMDLAMSRLFGGFDARFYEAYEQAYPLPPGWAERVPLYHLYYLLAHLNMFGRTYLGSVIRTIQRYA